MKDNIPGFMGYYVSKTGSVYSRYVRGSGWQTTCINDLDLEDLKKLRRVIRKAIREYENN